MKSKLILSISILSFCLFSCNSQTKQNETNSIYEDKNATSNSLSTDGKQFKPFPTPAPITNVKPTKQLDIKFYDVKDPNNGMTLTSVPLPGTWEQTSGKFQFIEPNGMKILGIRGGDFSYSDDPQKIQLFKMVGKKIEYPKSMDQIIQTYFIPDAEQANRKLMKTYSLPEAATFLKMFNDLQYKIDLTPIKFEGIATEWEDPDGTSYMTIIVKHQELGPNADSWGITFDAIQSPKANFEQAKRTLINYMVNQEINMDWIRKVNGDLKYKIDESNLQHQKMMAEVKRNMEVFQKGQEQRRADREVMDNRIANYILGKSDAVDPQTGAVAKVEAGSTYYWINEKGEYLSTEDYTWNPNEHEPYKKYNTWTRHQI